MIRILKILFWIALILGVGAAMVLAGQKHEETQCHEFTVEIESLNINPLTTAAEIKAQIVSECGSPEGKTLGEIDLLHIHRVLEKIPYIAKSDIQAHIDGNIHIGISLREPVIRIINRNAMSYYIDSGGWLMPVNQGHPGRVLIASGNIRDGLKSIGKEAIHIDSISEPGMLQGLFMMAGHIRSSAFLNALISQIYVEKPGMVKLVPVVGDNTIIFGEFDAMEEKFEKLTTYYREGAGKAGWIPYSTIDLRYQNQVICSKK